MNFGTEREHLKVISETERAEIEPTVKELLQAEPTITAYGIPKGYARMKVSLIVLK